LGALGVVGAASAVGPSAGGQESGDPLGPGPPGPAAG